MYMVWKWFLFSIARVGFVQAPVSVYYHSKLGHQNISSQVPSCTRIVVLIGILLRYNMVDIAQIRYNPSKIFPVEQKPLKTALVSLKSK